MERRSDSLTQEIIGAAITISKYWGNGVLESVYKKSFAHEMEKSGLVVGVEVVIPGVYDTIEFDMAFRADIVVNGAVIVEAKAISGTLPVHRHQLLTYMRLSGIPTGLLINFHANPFAKGIVRLSL